MEDYSGVVVPLDQGIEYTGPVIPLDAGDQVSRTPAARNAEPGDYTGPVIPLAQPPEPYSPILGPDETSAPPSAAPSVNPLAFLSPRPAERSSITLEQHNDALDAAKQTPVDLQAAGGFKNASIISNEQRRKTQENIQAAKLVGQGYSPQSAQNAVLAARVSNTPVTATVAQPSEELRPLKDEFYAQLAAGGAVDLPKMYGQALQWMSEPGKTTYEMGQDIAHAASRGEQDNPYLQAQLDGRGGVGTAISQGARAFAPSAALLGTSIAAAPLGAVAASGAIVAGGFALYGGSQAQQTKEAVLAAGGTERDANQAGWINYIIEGGFEAAGTLFGAQLLGVSVKTFKGIGQAAARNAVRDVTETGIVKPFFRQLAKTTLGESGTEYLQNDLEARVESSYGVKGHDPIKEGLQGAGAALVMTTMLAPFGLSHVVNRAAANTRIAAALENGDAPPLMRAAAAKVVFDNIAVVNKEAAAAWSKQASVAIASNVPISLQVPVSQKTPASTVAGPGERPVVSPVVNPATNDTSGVDPLTLEPTQQTQTPTAQPVPALPPPNPNQVAIAMAEPLPVTEVPVVDKAQAHADAVYAARATEEARLVALTPSQIEVDTQNPLASIQAIVDAPLTPVTGHRQRSLGAAPPGVSETLHGQTAGDVAGILLHASDLERQAQAAPAPERAPLVAQAAQLRDQARQVIQHYGTRYGAPAAAHLRALAAEQHGQLVGSLATPTPTAPHVPGVPVAGGAVSGVEPGSSFKISPRIATTGGVMAEHTSADGSKQSVYIGINGKALPASAVQYDNQSTVEQVWVPHDPMRRAQATEILQQMGALPAGAEHDALAATLKTVVSLDKAKARAAERQQAKSVQNQTVSTKREQPVGVNDALRQRSAEGVGTQPGRTEGPGRGGEGGRVGQGQQGTEATTARQTEAGRVTGDNQLGAGEVVPKTGTIVPKMGTTVILEGRLTIKTSGDGWSSPLAIHSNIKRGPLKASLSEVRQHAELIVRETSRVIKDIGGGRSLNISEHPVLAALIRDVLAAGVPDAAIKGLSSFHLYTPGTTKENGRHGLIGDNERSIGFNDALFQAAVNGNEAAGRQLFQTLIHELGHELDTFGKVNGRNDVSSYSSPLFEIAIDPVSHKRTYPGAVIAEAKEVWLTTANHNLKVFLSYPFVALTWNPQEAMASGYGSMVAVHNMVREELFAQLSVLYYTQRPLLKAALPKAYAMMKDAHNALNKTTTISDARAAIRASLQSTYSTIPEPLQLVIRRPEGAVGGRVGEGIAPVGEFLSERSRNYLEERRQLQGDGEPGNVSTAVTYRDESKNPLGKKQNTIEEIGAHFDALIRDQFGGALDFKNPEHFARAVKMVTQEFQYQITQSRTGLDWYSGDIKQAYELSTRLIPELNDESHRQTYSIVAAILSPATQANENWVHAIDAYRHFVETGLVPEADPNTGAAWSLYGKNNAKAIAHLNFMIAERGREGATEWLLTEHTIAELRAERMRSGVFKTPAVPGKKGNTQLGVYLFGPKVGPFALNLNGIDTEVTVDKWLTRTFLRQFGLLVNKQGQLQDSPSEPERRAIKLLVRNVAKSEGYSHSQVQAVLWFFEQQLYIKLGAGVASKFFSDGAKEALQAHGINYDTPGSSTNESGGNVTGVAPQEQQNAVYDDFREDPEAALKKTGWAIVTANKDEHDADTNAVANDALDSLLTKRGIEHYDVSGTYKGVDQGRNFLMFAPADESLAIAKRFKQESIATTNGLEYTDGHVEPWNHDATVVGPAALKGDHTVLPDGTAFSLVPQDTAIFKSSVASTDLRGDGRGFTNFFSAASRGERAPDVKTYKPVLDISGIKAFSDEYVTHRGNFDDHIATSIPGFREVQQIVGNAIVKAYSESGARLLDIAASEGAFNKTITKLSGGSIKTLALDPNLTMAKFFKEHSTVPGATYDVSAFGSSEDAGKVAWTEDDGTQIRTFDPKVKYDIVHESMGFQFIGNTRDAQFARVKELMKPDGIALFEEKIKEDTPAYVANETKKDAYKAQYFTAEHIKAKAAEVLDKGVAATKEATSQAEQAIVGMNNLMVTGPELEKYLNNNWEYVAQYWDSGNFKGYVASDSRVAINRFIENMSDTNSEFSATSTPSPITQNKLNEAAIVKVSAIESETGRQVDVSMPAGEALASIDSDAEKVQRLISCLSS